MCICTVSLLHENIVTDAIECGLIQSMVKTLGYFVFMDTDYGWFIIILEETVPTSPV